MHVLCIFHNNCVQLLIDKLLPPPSCTCPAFVLQYFTSFKHLTSEYERRDMVEKFAKLHSKLQQVRDTA